MADFYFNLIFSILHGTLDNNLGFTKSVLITT
jgi:hypothetical protein